jgi:hypothetical protein
LTCIVLQGSTTTQRVIKGSSFGCNKLKSGL